MTQAQDLANLSQLFSGWQLPFRNRIINGASSVVQRAAINCTAGVQGYGGPDRFTAANNASGAFIQQYQATFNNSAPGGLAVRSGIQQVCTVVPAAFTANQYWAGLAQNIEGANCFDMVGQPLVLSMLFGSNVAGPFSISIRDGTAGFSYVTTFQCAGSSSLQRIVVPIPPIPVAATIPNGSSNGMSVWISSMAVAPLVAPSVGSWIAGNYITAPGAVNWATAVNNWIGMTDLQIETGVVATPFERKPFHMELAACLRYFEKQGYTAQSTLVYIGRSWAVQKRVAPTITVSGGSSNGATFATDIWNPANSFRQVTGASGPSDCEVSGSAEI